jgi:hypothetical protein
MAKQHDPIAAPSSLQYLALCPGRGQQCKNVPQTTSKAMEDGDDQHEIIAAYIEAAIRKTAMPEIEERFQEPISIALQHLNNIASTLSGDATILIEHKLTRIKAVLGIEHGTLDFAAIDGVRAALIDFKFGTSFVDSPLYNLQLQTYAVALFAEYPQLETIDAHIVQPNVEEEWQHKSATYTREMLAEFRERIIGIVKVARSENPPLVPGHKQCKWCRAKMSCPARIEQTAIIPVGTVDLNEYVRQITPADRAKLLERAQMVMNYCGALIGTIETEAISNGIEVDGYEIGNGRSSRVWTDEDKARDVLERLATEKDLPGTIVTELVSVAQAEEILGKSKAVREAMAGVVKQQTGKVKLVRAKQSKVA